MPLVLKDRVRETTTSTGTGTITLAGAVSGFQSFSVIGNGNTTYYAIIDSVNGTWEVGIGTYTSAGTTLSRDTVLSSSNSGSLVSFAAGTKDVICTQPSSKAIYGDANNNVGINGTTSAWSTVTALQIQNSSFYNATGETGIVSNTYYNSGWKYISTGAATQYTQSGGGHYWLNAPSGTAGNAISFTQAMTLDASGNLGIGTSSPVTGSGLTIGNDGSGAATVKLAFSTSAAERGSISMTGANAEMRLTSGYSGYGGFMTFYANGSERMRLDSSGNLGIGTSSPTRKLTVVSETAGLPTLGTGSGGLFLSSNNGLYGLFGGVNGLTGDTWLQAMRNDAATAYNIILNPVGGNLGLGVTPSAWSGIAASMQLADYGNITSTGTRLWIGANYYYNSGEKYTGTGLASRYRQSDGAHLWDTAPSGTAGNAISFTQAMTLDASGNLGLGVTPGTWAAAAKALELAYPTYGMAANGGAFVSFNAREGSSGNWVYKSTDEASRLELNPDGGFRFFTAPSGTAGNAISFTRAMTLDNSGRLAIGSTAPQSWSTSQAVIEMYPSNGAGYINMNGASTYGGYLYWNMYFNGTSNICINTGAVGAAGMNGSGGHDVYVGTGTAGSAASLTLVTSIDSSANFMVGTSSSTGAGGLTIQSVTNGRTVYNNNNGAATGFVFQTFRRSGTEIGSITQNGTTAVLYNTTSDYRLKENVQPISGALDRVAKLKPSTYRWKSDGSDGEGFLAHELAEVCPLAVNGKKDAVDAKGDPKYQSIDPSKVVALLTAAVQELTQQVRELKAEVATLKGN